MIIYQLSLHLDDVFYPVMFSFDKDKLESFIQQVRKHDSDYCMLSEEDELAKDIANETHPLKPLSVLFDDDFYGFVNNGYTYAEMLHIDKFPLDEVITL